MGEAFKGLPDADVWRRPDPRLLSVGELAAHVAYGEAQWLLGEAGMESPPRERRRPLLHDETWKGPFKVPMGADELLREVQRVHSVCRKVFSEDPPDSEALCPHREGATWGFRPSNTRPSMSHTTRDRSTPSGICSDTRPWTIRKGAGSLRFPPLPRFRSWGATRLPPPPCRRATGKRVKSSSAPTPRSSASTSAVSDCWAQVGPRWTSIATSRYCFTPVPAGMRRPMMTFSFKPMSWSFLPRTAASVRTRVVFWNDAAERNDSVASDASVMPRRIQVAVASLYSRSTFSPVTGSTYFTFEPALIRSRTASFARW